MPKDFGVDVTLLPQGKIKRDLTGPAGKTSLEETTIQNELILFSELNFEPYAMVVDAIRNMAADIMRQDNDHYGEIDMDKYQLMVDTTIDLVVTLEGEDQMQGTLLRTRIEDEIPQDDGSAMYPIRTGQTILSILTGIMDLQFVVNEVLHDLAEGLPLDPEKYDELWELSLSQTVTMDGGISARYHFRSAVDYYHFLLLHFVASKTRVAFCQCCGRYFIPRTKSKTIYCDRILKENKTCKHWGPILKHRLEALDKVIKTFDQAQKRMYKRYERTADGKKKPTPKDLSYDDYYVWLDAATAARDAYLREEMTAEEALKIIDVR